MAAGVGARKRPPWPEGTLCERRGVHGITMGTVFQATPPGLTRANSSVDGKTVRFYIVRECTWGRSHWRRGWIS